MEALKGESKYPHINTTYIKDVDKLHDMNDRDFTVGIQGKFYYMIQWMQNINFLAGNQWIKYNEHKKMFEIEPNIKAEERVTFNKVLPAYRLAVGALLRDRQKAKVLQVNEDEQSIDSAKVSTQLLEHIRRVNNGLSVQKEILEWSAICGKGINKKWYDPDKDKIVDEVLQPFEWVTPSNVRKLEKMPWVCHARYETVEWAYEMYGITVEGNTDYGQYGSFLAAVKNVMEDGYFVGGMNVMNDNNVLIKEFWYRPCKDYPKGMLVIYAGDELIYADKNPISKDDDEYYFPFNEMDFFDLPFRYWPMGLIEPMVGIQAYYNKFQSYALENFKYAGAPVMLYQEGSIDEDSVIMEPGAGIPWTGNHPPTFEVPQAVSPQMFEVINQLSGGIGEIIGIHQFTRGSMPPGVHAAAAMAIINEQDQITKMMLTINLEKFVRTDARQNLYLVRKFWPNKQKIRVMGEENRWEVVEFDKSVLTGEEEIEIESKQELAQDKMTRFDQVMKLMTTPKLDNPKESIMEVNAGLRILDLEQEMGTVSLRNLNWNMAKTENEKLAKSERVMAFQYEDHRLHIEAHMQYMLRVDFKELDEKIRNNFLEHYQQHVMMLNGVQQDMGAQQSQTDQQQQGMMQGQPGMMQPGMMPQGPMGMPQGPQMGGMPMGQPMMPQGPMQPQGPMPPMQGMPMGPTGLAGGMQGGMQNVLNQAAGRPGGR